ncbi:MAG: glycoside hydrolase family 2 TIM barrel-domain containing protein [Nocardioides sp.]|nr:glycoside hydrolase family 2 TIM barrel-domain containing protein [Nocardioides sp.]
MLTPWGRDLDPDDPWPEHPRPQLVRDSWVSLNGWWDHAVRPADAPAPDGQEDHDGPIVVPFSPEAVLSRAGREGRPLRPDEVLHYRRRVVVPQRLRTSGHRLLLHFGAVDQTCVVAVDAREVGRHDGGFWPFTIDVTTALVRGFGELTVTVTDPTEHGTGARGKQRLEPGRIWYPAQSGIWQSVWLESVPAVHVTGVRCDPLLDLDDPAGTAVRITVETSRPSTARVRVGGDGRESVEVVVPSGAPVEVALPHARLWSPEDPHLYDVEVVLDPDGDHDGDRVTSYVGIREVRVAPDGAGVPRILLNGAAYPMVGVLDQGYWPDGLLTPPSDAALVHDITAAQELGFTVLRKHVKIEPLRFYHHCDQLGMLVWQDLVNGGGRYRSSLTELPGLRPVRVPDRGPWVQDLLGRGDAEGRADFERDLVRTVDLLRGSPSVVLWTIFNEGWGQYDARRLTGLLRDLDPSRPVSPASGWHDQGGSGPAEHGEVCSLHVYGRAVAPSARLLRRERERGRAVVLGEYGGFQLVVPGHHEGTESFGYREIASTEELEAALESLERDEVLPARGAGVAGTVYTQLTDVAGELNGLLTWDRAVQKVARFPGRFSRR